MQYKGAHKDAAQIAHELGAAYLLEGSVRREGQRVRVTAQLIQAGDQSHLWADSFDRDLNDILKLQSELARDFRLGIFGQRMHSNRRLAILTALFKSTRIMHRPTPVLRARTCSLPFLVFRRRPRPCP